MTTRLFAVVLLCAASCSDPDPEPIPVEDVAEDIAADTGEPEPDVPDVVLIEDVEDAPDVPPVEDVPDVPKPPIGDELTVMVQVLLDGEPSPDTLVVQGGRPFDEHRTDDEGRTLLTLDLTIVGTVAAVASHPEARIKAVEVLPEFLQDEYVISLERFDVSDNLEYDFPPVGTPDSAPTTEYCGHCHITMMKQWYGSPHRAAASNPPVQDLYAGTAAALATEEACTEAGGAWLMGLTPGTGVPALRCYLGAGVLPALNPGCADGDATCDDNAEVFGGCADCHAPGINGKLGGRDLLEATGLEYDEGVTCQACHGTESIDLEAEPGVAGRLKIIRPSEVPISPTLGLFAPLTFGPGPDVVSVRMGSVQRGLFHKAELCSGCHEQLQPALVPGTSVDTERWPSGKLPIHTTYTEWKAGPMNPGAPCQSCHMPPNPQVTNSADQQILTEAPIGIVSGWLRPPGTANSHTWVGPRAKDSQMLQLAAGLFVKKTVADGVLTAAVKTKNVGPGHALPTGEPMRSMALTVQAFCGDEPQAATGGDVVPAFGGYLARQAVGADWSVWPGAEAGQVVRVVTLTGQWHDYVGYGPFGDGTFTAEQKGMPVQHYAGEAMIESVDGDVVTFATPLPDGDIAYRVQADTYAGAPGFGFARVLTGPDGAEMVPHFLAVDVASDNRLLPQKSFTSNHTFAVACEDPTVQAVLWYRSYPRELALERGWPNEAIEMTRATR